MDSYINKTGHEVGTNRPVTVTEYFSNGLELDQAYRLYTLALAGSPDLGAMNRFVRLFLIPLKMEAGSGLLVGWAG